MILERIFDLALPNLAGKKIRDVRIGLNLMGIELDDGSLGITYVLRNEVGHGCTALPHAGNLVGIPAVEIARWVLALTGKNVLSVAMGLAVLNSVAEFDKLKQAQAAPDLDAASAVEVLPSDTVGVIGHIGPVIANLKNKVQRLLIFERGQIATGQIYPETTQPELLPECNVIFVSSTSLINETLEKVLSYCTKARDVVMVGASTPLYPDAFRGTGVTVLSGTRWQPPHSEAILAGISQSAGVKQLMKYGEKISFKVN